MQFLRYKYAGRRSNRTNPQIALGSPALEWLGGVRRVLTCKYVLACTAASAQKQHNTKEVGPGGMPGFYLEM